MNAKPTLDEVKSRDSQLSLGDLYERFRVLETRWLVYRDPRRGYRACGDTSRGRKQLEARGLTFTRVAGCPRNVAINAVRNSG